VKQQRKNKPHSDFLVLSDKLRDEVLPPLGLKLTDNERGSVWGLVDAELLVKEAAAKRAGALTTVISKLQNKLSKIDGEINRLESGKIPPADVFAKTEYSKFDKDGVPTHTSDGKELQKTTKKKLDKTFKNQVKLHQQYLEKMKDPEYLNRMNRDKSQLVREIHSLQSELSKANADSN